MTRRSPFPGTVRPSQPFVFYWVLTILGGGAVLVILAMFVQPG